jgi:uncharacterized GH25 family protein
MRTRETLTSIAVFLLVAALPQGSAGKFQRSPVAEPIVQEASPDKPSRTHKGIVTADVVDDSGKPVAGATVVLTDSVLKDDTSSQTTDKKGMCKFTGLFPGVYTIQAKKDGMESNSEDLKVSNEQTTTAKLVLSPKK